MIPSVLMYLHNERKGISDFKAGLKVELTEVRALLMMNSYILSSKRGWLDRELLEEAVDYMTEREYELPGYIPLEAIERLKTRVGEMADEEAARVLSSMRGDAGSRFNLKHFDISFLRSNIDKIPRLPTRVQQRIVVVLHKVNQINEEVDAYNERQVLTFSTSSAENHEILNRNMDSSEEIIAKQGRVISKLISELLNFLDE